MRQRNSPPLLVDVCAGCGMEIAGEPVWRAGEVFCCEGCALGTGCTCVV